MAGARSDTWMPFYIGDYLRDTGRLTTEGHGAYVLLIFDYWTSGAPLPDDDEQLAAIARLPLRQWQKLRPIVARFFRVADGKWAHKRIDAEIANSRDLTAAKSAAGYAGGIAARGKSGRPKGAKKIADELRENSKANGAAMANGVAGEWQKNTPSPSPKSKSPLPHSGTNGHAKPDEPQEVVEAFFAIREVVFGTPAPHGISPLEHSIAAGWLEDGASFYPVRDLFERRMRAMQGKGKNAPGGLKYLDDAVREAMAQNFPGYSP